MEVKEKSPGPSRSEAKAEHVPLLHKLEFKHIDFEVILPMLLRLLLWYPVDNVLYWNVYD